MSESQLPNVCSAWFQEQIIVKEFFKSISIKHVIEYHGWNMGAKFLYPAALDFEKKLWCHVIQDFQCSE